MTYRVPPAACVPVHAMTGVRSSGVCENYSTSPHTTTPVEPAGIEEERASNRGRGIKKIQCL